VVVVKVLTVGAGILVSAVVAFLVTFVCVVNSFPLPEDI